ncbi:Nonribosomal peptide synthetase 12 [Cercospora beticola]|uniref:Nonribosomal peptide synthetase 12 n=1 Tax=Cercospora beticola TaxID=122368 RepID=A0A2G5HYV3_CERBT|nr:Nonribosomal peptide synthetase 12 [Cercospora beticola]PIA97725.1 Nonribosomal peptide synthetase 12 [Cercospora beticola]WPA99320.1 hypothetical protein RHO25_003937 [Cercospora beticola]CAK1360644.1 unnamed protein product [Cercospora beticola]
MSATATIDATSQDGDNESIERILLACALLRSRQQMTADVAFTAHIENAVSSRSVQLNLDIDEQVAVGSLISQIENLTIHQSNVSGTDEQGNGQPDKDQDLLFKLTGSCWHIQGDFSMSYATSFEQTLQHVYRQICESPPECMVSSIEVVGKEDIRWLLDNSVKEVPPANPLDGAALFQQCIAEWHQDVAVDAWDGRLTYAELDKGSTRLAALLIARGVRPGTVLPLLFQYSKWVVISVLATWKAGAAFVFIDPTHPPTRIRNLVQQVQAPFVLTQRDLSPDIELGGDVRSLVLESMKAEVDDLSGNTEISLPSVDPESPAYIIFTSGSTGQPKAAVHTHLAFCSGALHQAELLGFSRTTRTIENAPLIFAGAIPELLFTILRGGCLCIATLEDRTKDIAACVRKFQTNMLVISSSVAAAQDPAQFVPRQRLLMGAESLPSHTAKAWAASHDNCNGYGSTETNTVATCCPINSTESVKNVGRGAAHQYWVVDALDYNRLLPPGWLGEVIVEGHALAAEYLGNPEATNKAFPPVPRWVPMVRGQKPCTTRFFRTGDLGRIAEDGGLEVHGRTDPLQVKLRGQRIELGEIEAVTIQSFEKTPLVAELIHPKGQDRPSIALFFVATTWVEALGDDFFEKSISLSESQRLQLEQVRESLVKAWDDSLPAYMKPSYLVPLSKLPRTQTGKLDRKGLREMASRYEAADISSLSTRQNALRSSGQPSVEIDDRVRDAVCQVLSIAPDQLDGRSAFTVLGGDSLGAIELAQELRCRGLLISPADIIRADSLQSLTEYAEENAAVTNGDRHAMDVTIDGIERDHLLQRLHLSADQVKEVLPTTDSQSRAIKLATGPERSFVYHFILDLSGTVDNAKLESSLQRLVARHDILRTLFTDLDGQILQVVLNEAQDIPQFKNVESRSALQSTIDELTAGDVLIDRVPTKIFVLLVENTAKCLVFRLSHAQFDGLSIPNLWSSLQQCYDDQNTPPAPEYSSYIKEILGADPKPAIEYYTQLLRDVPFTDLVKRETKDHEPQNCHRHAILMLKQSVGYTAATVFEAAWSYVLASASACRAVAFDQVVSGRQLSPHSNVDVRNLVGACLNDVPVVVKHLPRQTVHMLMKQIQDERAASAKYETLGFTKILGTCTPDHWPADARMTSSVQYRGFEERKSFQLGDANCEASMVERSMDLEDLTVVVTPQRGEESYSYDVEFLFSDRVVSHEQADHWFQQFIRAFEAFTSDDAPEKEVEILLGCIAKD